MASFDRVIRAFGYHFCSEPTGYLQQYCCKYRSDSALSPRRLSGLAGYEDGELDRRKLVRAVAVYDTHLMMTHLSVERHRPAVGYRLPVRALDVPAASSRRCSPSTVLCDYSEKGLSDA